MNWLFMWLVALVVFILIEAVTYQIVTIWFAIGALGAAICAMMHGPLYLQIGVFFALSIILLCIMRPLSMHYLKSKDTKTNVDSLIGKQIMITETVDNLNGTGKAKLFGMEWTVRSDDGSKIDEGEIVIVKKIEGVKLIVERKVD